MYQCTQQAQIVLNCAVNYISNHGLRFNPGKSQCIIYGKNPFNLQPSWHIDTCELQIAENLEYLGTFLGHNGSNAHISKRITSCRRAFYSLQGAGICKNGLEINTAVYVFKATCLGILKYASDSVHLSQKQRSDLIKMQGNLLKCLVGLGPRYRTTPLLNAVYMSKVSSIIDMGNISLLNQIMRISSAARTFNNIMLQKDSACPKILINRVKQICSDNNLNFVDVVTSPEHIRHMKSKILPYVKDGQDGMIDSIRLLLNCKTPSDISLLRLLLKPY